MPYSDEVLAPGMVIMLEPGIYFPGETGVRVEDAYLLTEDGAVQWTAHDKSIGWARHRRSQGVNISITTRQWCANECGLSSARTRTA
ncbi:MAG: M24 family metallopeptidase [Anaerolineales bacterium]|nr:M24 family metallopeptidase [Anaerolineales bacterium]